MTGRTGLSLRLTQPGAWKSWLPFTAAWCLTIGPSWRKKCISSAVIFPAEYRSRAITPVTPAALAPPPLHFAAWGTKPACLVAAARGWRCSPSHRHWMWLGAANFPGCGLAGRPQGLLAERTLRQCGHCGAWPGACSWGSPAAPRWWPRHSPRAGCPGLSQLTPSRANPHAGLDCCSCCSSKKSANCSNWWLLVKPVVVAGDHPYPHGRRAFINCAPKRRNYYACRHACWIWRDPCRRRC